MTVDQLIAFTSDLRKRGRSDDAVGLLAEAVAAHPDTPVLLAFLALALLEAGHPKAALATMLGCALDSARSGSFDGYERELTELHQELLSPSQS